MIEIGYGEEREKHGAQVGAPGIEIMMETVVVARSAKILEDKRVESHLFTQPKNT